jgi:hypothetical protein
MLTRTCDPIHQEIMHRCKTFRKYVERNWKSKYESEEEERKCIDVKMKEVFEKVQCAISHIDEGVMHDCIKEVKKG